MATNALTTRILLCNATTASWAGSTAILLKGEVGIEFTDTIPRIKIGNGVDEWSNLEYISLTSTEIQTLIDNAIGVANHTHENKDVLDEIEVALTEALKACYDAAYQHSLIEHAPSDAQANVIESVSVNGTTLEITDKNVNVSVPEALSQLTNDVGYITEDTNTTYNISASVSSSNGDAAITLVGSDSTTEAVSIVGAGATKVTTDANGVITVTSENSEYEHPLSGTDTGTFTKVTVDEYGHVTAGENPTTLDGYGITDAVNVNQLGAANGVATLNESGYVTSSQLPSYVDDVIEGYCSDGVFYEDADYTVKLDSEADKIYVDLLTEKIYRWSGSLYVVISDTITLGETAETAYYGDKGKIAYEHAISEHAPADAEPNQEAFAVVKVGSTSVEADTVSSTLNLKAGDNVTITADADTDTITIASTNTDTTYSAGSGLVLNGTTFNHSNSIISGTAQGSDTQELDYGSSFAIPTVTYDAQGHITGTGTTVLTLPEAQEVTTNSETATALETPQAIDGVMFDGTTDIAHYGECTTLASTTTKEVAIDNFNLATGARAIVKFTINNEAVSPTLNVNKTGAKSIMYRGNPIEASYLLAGHVYEFVYDGTNYELVGDINTDGSTADTLTTARTISLGTAVTATPTSFDGSEDIEIPVTSVDTMYLVVGSTDTLILDGGSSGYISDVDTSATGGTAGTVNINGTEVAVAGLGTAAYTDTTAYDAAGSAAAVQTTLESEIASVKNSIVTYIGTDTNSASTTIASTGAVSVDVNVSENKSNILTIDSDGLCVALEEITTTQIVSLFA